MEDRDYGAVYAEAREQAPMFEETLCTVGGLTAASAVGDLVTRELVLGDGEPVATLRGEPFELLRAMSGRRSADRVRALDWEGEPGPFLDLLSAYDQTGDDLVE